MKYADHSWVATCTPAAGKPNWDGAVIETGYYALGTITVNGSFSTTANWGAPVLVSPVAGYVQKGDTVQFTITFNQNYGFDYKDFGDFTFTLPDGSAATSVKAELTTVGTATVQPVVTVTVTLGNTLTDGQPITVETAVKQKA